MIDAIDEELAMVNPVSDATVRRVTGSAARSDLLAALLADAPHRVTDPDSSDPVTAPPPKQAGGRRWRRTAVAPVLAAAGVAAIALLSAVGLQIADAPDGGETGPAASPTAGEASTCADLDVPRAGAQVVDRRAGSTFCAQVALEDRTPGEAPMAWSAFTPTNQDPSVQVTFLVDPVSPPADDAVLVLGGTGPDGGTTATHQVFGLSGDRVTGVEIVLPDETRIPAVLDDGVWGAWWPVERGGLDSSRVRVTTNAGTATSDIDALRLPAMATPPASGPEDPLARSRQES